MAYHIYSVRIAVPFGRTQPASTPVNNTASPPSFIKPRKFGMPPRRATCRAWRACRAALGKHLLIVRTTMVLALWMNKLRGRRAQTMVKILRWAT